RVAAGRVNRIHTVLDGSREKFLPPYRDVRLSRRTTHAFGSYSAGTSVALVRAMVHPRLTAARCVLLTTILWNAPALAGKLSELREETDSSSHDSGRSGDRDEGSSWLLLALLGNDAPYAPGYSASVDDTSAPRVLRQQSWYFPLYPYRGDVPGNLARRNFTFAAPIASGCTNSDSSCHRARRVVACVDSTCYSE